MRYRGARAGPQFSHIRSSGRSGGSSRFLHKQHISPAQHAWAVEPRSLPICGLYREFLLLFALSAAWGKLQ
jgi:hypothetical protein